MEQHVSSIRAEVLRQLIGVSGGWFVRIIFVSVMFWLVFYVYESLVDGTLSGRLSLLKQALFNGAKEFKVKTISTSPFLYFLVGMMLLTTGYTLGYNISTNYISGEITLITTVARITNFYALTVSVIEMILMACTALVFLSAASSIRRNGRAAYQISTLAKLNLGLLKFFRLFGILAVISLGIASMVFCYLVIK
jgi:hypothetical protein